jgi:hypothetical protein
VKVGRAWVARAATDVEEVDGAVVVVAVVVGAGGSSGGRQGWRIETDPDSVTAGGTTSKSMPALPTQVPGRREVAVAVPPEAGTGSGTNGVVSTVGGSSVGAETNLTLRMLVGTDVVFVAVQVMMRAPVISSQEASPCTVIWGSGAGCA